MNRLHLTQSDYKFKRYETITNCMDTYLILGFHNVMNLKEYKVFHPRKGIGYINEYTVRDYVHTNYPIQWLQKGINGDISIQLNKA